MSKFYGTLRGSRGQATRCGTAHSGLTTIAASWAGAIEVFLSEVNGVECFTITMTPWKGRGISKVIAVGEVGKFATPVRDNNSSENQEHLQSDC